MEAGELSLAPTLDAQAVVDDALWVLLWGYEKRTARGSPLGIGVDGLLPRGEEGLEHFFLGL